MSTRTNTIGPSFRKLERRLRRALAWRGVADLCLLAASVVILSFALDRLIELPWLLRLVTLLSCAGGYIAIVQKGRRRARTEVAANDLLATVEKSKPNLRGQLVNAVELRAELRRARQEGREELEVHLLRRALRESQQALLGLDASRALDLRSLRYRQLAACAGLLAVTLLIVLSPSNFLLWARRNVLLSNQPWPRQTHFVLEWDVDWGDPVRHVARQDAVEIAGWVVGTLPRDVYLHLKAGGEERRSRFVPGVSHTAAWGGSFCSEELAGAPGEGEEAEGWRLSFSLSSVAESFEFYFVGGDNRSRKVRVEVHERPRIVSSRLRLEFPPHTVRSDGGELEDSAVPGESVVNNPAGEIRAVVGTQLEFFAEADQEITAPWARFGSEGRVPATQTGPRSFEYSRVLSSGFLELGMASAEWGFTGKPKRLALVARPDRPPDVQLVVRGKTRLITPRAAIGYGVQATDDFGLSRVALRFGKDRALVADRGTDRGNDDGQERGEVRTEGEGAETQGGVTVRDLAPWTIERFAEGVRLVIERELELEPLGLEAGGELYLQAMAVDNDEPAGLKTAYSNVEVFTLVAPERLREEMDRVRVVVQAKLEELAGRERSLAAEVHVSEVGPGIGSGTQSPGTQSPGTQSPGTQSPGTQSPGTQSPGTQSPGTQSPGTQSPGTQSPGTQSPGTQSPGTQSPGTQSPGTQSPGTQSPGTEQGSRPTDDPFSRLAGEQDSIAEEARRLRGELEEMADTLAENDLMNDAERRRFDDEVARPLGDLGEERLPRSARDIEAIPQADRPSDEAEQARENLDGLAQDLEAVADRLGESADFKEILQRLEIIVELQKEVITETHKGARDTDGQGVEGGTR